MSDLYHIKEIEGKGRGVVASKLIKKGTLILKEEPQIPKIETKEKLGNLLSKLEQMTMSLSEEEEYLEREFKSNVGMKLEFEKFVEKLMSFFNRMSPLNQKEYLEFSVPEFGGLKTIVSSMEKDSDKAEKILKNVSLYLGHNWKTWPDGPRIRMRLFNHSCHPNATLLKNTDGKPLRAISDIQPGQEITFEYGDFGLLAMRSKKIRQKIILNHCNFICLCDLCKEYDEPSVNQSQMDELVEEVQNLHIAMVMGLNKALPYIKPGSSLGPLPPTVFGDAEYRKGIACLKQLYKLGKEMGKNPECLYRIVQIAYHAASLEHGFCELRGEPKLMEEFKKECLNFAKAAEKFGKILGNDVVKPEVWKERHQNFKGGVF